MAYLKVLNVGQGDCCVIRPLDDCMYKRDVFYVDVGPGQIDVTKEINKDDRIHIILTHHHSDHINGMKYFFDKFSQIEDITVPYCFNEISLMAKAILNLKGTKAATNCQEYIKSLNEIIDNQLFLKAIINSRFLRVNLAYEGYKLCNHISFLNPPLSADEEKIFNSEFTENDLQDFAYSLFEPEFASKFVSYVNAVDAGYGEDHRLSEYFLYGKSPDENEPREAFIRKSKEACKRIVCFFIDNIEQFQQFNRSPSKLGMRKIYENYTDTAHDVCIVMKAQYANRRFLLTGDASKKVFNRLISQKKDIGAFYLKVPHHGSRNNLNKTILNAINPHTAVISHDNGKFGRAIDPHPNKYVMDLLENAGIDIKVTNDVKKCGKVRFPKSPYRDTYLEVE